MKKLDSSILNKVLEEFKIKSNSNIYLSLDIMKLAVNLNLHKKNMEEFANSVLVFFLDKIGKNGNLAIPVFNEDSINKGFFDRKTSLGQSGAFGNLLLKKNFNNRSRHPYVSYLFFGKDAAELININNQNSEGLDSPWQKIINKNFIIVTLGHHYQRAFSIIHYLEKLANVDYRFDKKFNVEYTDFDGKAENKEFSFFARKLDICEFSSITKHCDDFFVNEKIVTFFKHKSLLSFRMDLNTASEVIINDLKKGSEKFISYARDNIPDKNKHILYGKNLLNFEISLLNQ
jgi:aminoglycoside N3'-acetyltransferase